MATATEPGPELGFLPEGFHATEHPRAGSKLVLTSGDARLHGKAVNVVDWYDRVYKQSWKTAALGGDPLATTYANRLAIHGLPDNPHAVIVQRSDGHAALVHQSELPDPQSEP